MAHLSFNKINKNIKALFDSSKHQIGFAAVTSNKTYTYQRLDSIHQSPGEMYHNTFQVSIYQPLYNGKCST
jgi:hypothetical protein